MSKSIADLMLEGLTEADADSPESLADKTHQYLNAGGGSAGKVSVEDVTGTTYTVTEADSGKIKRFTNAAEVTVTLPANLAVGTLVNLLFVGAAGGVIEAGAGATVDEVGSVAQDEEVSAVVTSEDTWHVGSGGGASIHGGLLVGSDSYLTFPGLGSLTSIIDYTVAANSIFYQPGYCDRDTPIDRLGFEVAGAGGAGTKGIAMIYGADGDWQPTDLIVQTGELAIDSIAVKLGTVSATIPAGQHLRALLLQDAAIIRAYRGYVKPFIQPTMGISGIPRSLTVAQAYTAVAPDPGPAITVASHDANGFRHMTVVREAF